MRASILCAVALVLSACGSSTDTVPTRCNFAVIDGRNQASTAGTAQLAKPITSQLAVDPNGKFATGIFNWLAPAVAYAQTLTVSGTPVADAIVCGRETLPGEPKVVPLCAFTLADGKAANSVESGTKAGTYNIVFTAQDVGPGTDQGFDDSDRRAGPRFCQPIQRHFLPHFSPIAARGWSGAGFT